MYSFPVVVQAVVSGLMIGFLFALVAVGVTLIYGMMDLLNFAQGEMVVIGMYASFWTWKLTGWDPLFTLPVSALAVALVGVIVYKVLVRRLVGAPREAQMLGTFGLSIFLIGSMQFIWSPQHRAVYPGVLDGRVDIAGILFSRAQAVSAFIALLSFALLHLLLRKTETGRALLATAQDRQAASLVGIDTDRMYMLAWAIGGACAGIAGSLLSGIYSTHPTAGFGWAMAAYVAVVLGGFGSIGGALLGALLAGLIQVLSAIFVTPQAKLIILYSVFLAVLILRPKGIMGVR